MQAIIMAGGQGTRLKSVTGDTPKPMALLAGKPVLEHILLLLRQNGIRHVCMALRYRPEVIREYFGDGRRLEMQIEYHTEQEELGTAGCVLACREFYGKRDFLVISGDCACDYDLRALTEAHRRCAPAVTMALATSAQPLQYGTVLTNRTGQVVSFVEKPSWERVVSDQVSTGIYVISPRAMDRVPPDRPFDFAKDLFPLLLEQGETILGLPMEGYWCDIGTPQSYHQCNLDALAGRLRLAQPPPAAPAAAPASGAAAV
ncbi:MAG: nucleotidyltransferase family protein, partial [Oscillospiraceae bacterium]|nr:nucleotidyltransferase family protein [Oscillospiraceae bacterium]